jgi:hypothetical protein
MNLLGDALMALQWKREPWRKLYVREEGSFAALPLLARALAAELIKICDDHGIIRTGGRPVANAVAFQLGADQGDRRVLPRLLESLFADKYLVLESNGDVRIRNFRSAQMRWDRVRGDHELEAERSPVEPEPDVTMTRAVRESSASLPRVFRESSARGESTSGDLSIHAAPLETIRNDTNREGEAASRPPDTPDEWAGGTRPWLELAPPEPPKPKRKQQLPQAWLPNDAHRSLAASLRINLGGEAEKFRDWAVAKGEVKADWDAAFRNWLRGATGNRLGGGNGRPAQAEPPKYREE